MIPRAFMGLVETYVAQGNSAQALKLLREEIAKNPDQLEYRVALANIAVNANDYQTAISEYKKVLDKAPRSSDVWLRLGETYRRSGDLTSAAANFKKAQGDRAQQCARVPAACVVYDTGARRPTRVRYMSRSCGYSPIIALR